MLAKLLSGVAFAAIIPGACDPFYNTPIGSLQDTTGAFTYAADDPVMLAGRVSYKVSDPPPSPPEAPPPVDPPPDDPPDPPPGTQDPT